jgi:hypothetical protein
MPDFPSWFDNLSFIILWITSILAVSVFVHVWLIEKKGLAFNGLVGYVTSSYLWRLLYLHPVFAFCLPFFHGLQYLPFVYKFRKSELEEQKKRDNKTLKNDASDLMGGWVFIMAGIVLGALFFVVIPRIMDGLHGSEVSGFSSYFFVVAFIIFLNLHHFFIDHAFWRKDNVKVQKFLFNA